MRRISIAIDGPAASGKSTAARMLAERLGYIYIDTGAMYRAIALKALRTGTPLDAVEALTALADRTELRILGTRPAADGTSLCHLEMDGEDVSEEIRTPAVTHAVSPVSAISGVRRALVRQQRAMAAAGGVVMDGRDIGTVVLPRAELKVFLQADLKERIRRRRAELANRGIFLDEEEVRRQIEERDYLDSHRADSPLRPAPDAVVLDTTRLTVEEVLARLLALAREKGAEVPDAL
ncbi:MAG: (d)CMP kinase [Firmicutes bacterium]|nr:(d)CMP kinase [Bacillota bacterium]